jgi:hypothetical protein
MTHDLFGDAGAVEGDGDMKAFVLGRRFGRIFYGWLGCGRFCISS